MTILYSLTIGFVAGALVGPKLLELLKRTMEKWG